MATIHIAEADAARDFAALMAHARLGAEVVIEKEARAVAVVRPAVPAGLVVCSRKSSQPLRRAVLRLCSMAASPAIWRRPSIAIQNR